MSASIADATEHLSRKRRLGILGICCLSLFIVGVDSTAVNTALPSIGRELGADESQLQWVVDAYTVVLASLLMLSGSMGDRLGRRRVFQCGLVIFGLGSVLCSAAASPEMLIGSRMLQGIGGSMLNPVALSIVSNTFRDSRERAQAIGLWGAMFGLSMALGPVIGGALVHLAGWRAIFWLNLPIVIAALVLAALFVPESRAEQVRRVDPAAQVLLIGLLGGLVYAIIEGREAGWSSPLVLGCFAVAVVCLSILLPYELRHDEPLIDPRFFRSIPLSGAAAGAVVGFSAFAGFLFLNTLYLQEVRHLSPLDAGLMTLPMALSNAMIAPISGRIVGARGPRIPMVVSGFCVMLSALMLLRLGADTPWLYLGVAYLFFGIGLGLLNPPITNAAVSGMPRSQAGVAAAIASTSRQVGTALGIALLPTLAYAQLDADPGAGFAAATHVAWWVVMGCGAVIALLGVVTTSAFALASRDRAARELGVD